jgi:hypothetical protein
LCGRTPETSTSKRDSSYSDFLVAHPLVFANATDPLEADNWLRTMESKFGLLHCMEFQKTLYVAQLEPGGPPTPPPYLLITTFHGASSALPYVLTTYLRVFSIVSRRNSWTFNKGTILCLTTLDSSTPLLNMGHIMLIRMRRKPTSTVKGLPSTYKTAWFIPSTCPIMTW